MPGTLTVDCYCDRHCCAAQATVNVRGGRLIALLLYVESYDRPGRCGSSLHHLHRQYWIESRGSISEVIEMSSLKTWCRISIRIAATLLSSTLDCRYRTSTTIDNGIKGIVTRMMIPHEVVVLSLV